MLREAADCAELPEPLVERSLLGLAAKTTAAKSELSDEQKALIAAKMAKYKKN